MPLLSLIACASCRGMYTSEVDVLPADDVTSPMTVYFLPEILTVEPTVYLFCLA